MAPVIWGLDLKEIHYNKFGHKNMWNTRYHMRRTKFIVYQIAMIFCVCSESVGTAALDDYVHQQRNFEKSFTPRGPSIFNNDFVGIASYNIFVGIAVATVFGAAFFFDLIWPERFEPLWVKKAWKIAAVTVCVMVLGDALAFTVIVARNTAHFLNVEPSVGQAVLDSPDFDSANPNRVYRHNSYCVASVVLLWLGLVGTYVSAYILFTVAHYQQKHGVFSSKLVKDPTEKDHDEVRLSAATRVAVPSSGQSTPLTV